MYDVAGSVPDYRAARRRRTRKRARWSTPPTHSDADRQPPQEGSGERRTGIGDESEDAVEEQGIYDKGGQCTLEKVETATIHLDTAVNHCSVSPDGSRLVAVGDTNEVHLYNSMLNGDYAHVHTFGGSEDASFSTDWSEDGNKFAVASQGEI